ncbi:unnamed protein product [Closterium sp. NIES-54]
MALRPSSVPQRVPLPSPPTSSLADGPDPESDLVRAASPTVPRLLATVVTDPSFESVATSALVAELVDFAAACRLDYAASLVAKSESNCHLSVCGECALGTDVLEDRQEDFECFAAAVPHLVSMLVAHGGDPDAPDIPTPRSYAEAITGPYSSQWQTAMNAEMASWKSTGTYVDSVPPPGANIGVDFFQAFSPSPKMTTFWVLLHVAAQHDYELYSLDFSTSFLQGSLHEEIWLRHPPGFTGSFPADTQWSLWRPILSNICISILVQQAATRSQQPHAALRPLLPAAYLLPACLPACCLLPPACSLPAACLLPACCLLLAAACLLAACCRLPDACLPACLLPASCLLPPACRLPAYLLAACCRLPAACLLPACCLPATCCLLPPACLPACCLLPPACSLPAACCLLPPACLLPTAACLLPAYYLPAACCLLPDACCLCLLPAAYCLLP